MITTFLSFLAVFTIILGAMGLDFITALSGAASALANVGPGIGDIIGPAGNYSSLDDPCLLYTSPSPRDQRGSGRGGGGL